MHKRMSLTDQLPDGTNWCWHPPACPPPLYKMRIRVTKTEKNCQLTLMLVDV